MGDRDGRRLRPEPMVALELTAGVHARGRAVMHARHGGQARHHPAGCGPMSAAIVGRRLQGPKPHEREPRREQQATGVNVSRHCAPGREWMRASD